MNTLGASEIVVRRFARSPFGVEFRARFCVEVES